MDLCFSINSDTTMSTNQNKDLNVSQHNRKVKEGNKLINLNIFNINSNCKIQNKTSIYM
jgi:hypothetical protein